VFDGEVAFKLYDTFGFPLDLTADVAREKGLTIDIDAFDVFMEKQKQRARKAGDFAAKQNSINIEKETEFLGYETVLNSSSVSSIIKDGELVDYISTGDNAIIILSESSFYAESGGQVGDQGILKNSKSQFNVTDTQKQASGAIEHHGVLKIGELKVNDTIEAQVNSERRKKIMKNHSATHLLHEALRQTLGDSVEQKGSLVDSEKLRFDFSHEDAVKPDSLSEVERIVNEQILTNSIVKTKLSDIESAKKDGVRALFGEKYGDTVRVLSMGADDFSVELCGGTHVERLGDISRFKIITENGIAAGIRRIEALSGTKALDFVNSQEKVLEDLSHLLKTKDVVKSVSDFLLANKKKDKELEKLKLLQIDDLIKELLDKSSKVNGVNLLSQQLH
jgi:alanyl-tRNA synthetase